MDITQLSLSFSDVFGEPAQHIAFAPGRVNLIGEYTDFNGGHVFPCALGMGTYVLAAPRADRAVHAVSLNFPDSGVVCFDLDGLCFDPARHWVNYPAGVFAEFMHIGASLPHGVNLLFAGDLPNGTGLSSSASIEVATAVLLREMFNVQQSQTELALLAQRAENRFNGMNCGIMDQFASAMGRANHAILLNTADLSHEYVPLDLGEAYVLLIANTNKQRALAESKYNQRRAECEAALADLRAVPSLHGLRALCELDSADFARYADVVVDPLARQRARHVVDDNARTLAAVKVLRAGDIQAFGQLLNASHVSLRDDFAVTGEHLDALVQAAWDSGAVGARMTGAGFGGCAVMVVRADEVVDFKHRVSAQYHAQTALEPTFYEVIVGAGARMLDLPNSSELTGNIK